jgi:hypothetical protein
MAQSAPQSDNFKGRHLKAFWIASSPNPASSVRLKNGSLVMLASYQNGGSDLWPGSNYKAPILLQPIDPASDWVVTIEIDFAPTNDFQGAGLLLATQPGSFTDASQFNRIAERQYYPDGGGEVVRSVGGYVAYTGTVSYVRVKKIGSTFTGFISSDGQNWSKSGSAQADTAWSYIGLFTIRQAWDSATVDSKAAFPSFAARALN